MRNVAVEFLLGDGAKEHHRHGNDSGRGEHELGPLEAIARTPNTVSPGKAWLRALELTAPIARNRHRNLSTVIEERAAQLGDTPALLSDRECMTYWELSQRINRYARWALEQGIGQGEVVGLLMTNRPEYLAVWLGITSVGGSRLPAEYQFDWSFSRPLYQCCTP